jgi:hypothetical protein
MQSPNVKSLAGTGSPKWIFNGVLGVRQKGWGGGGRQVERVKEKRQVVKKIGKAGKTEQIEQQMDSKYFVQIGTYICTV